MSGIRPSSISHVLRATRKSSLTSYLTNSRPAPRFLSTTPSNSNTQPGTDHSPKEKHDAQQDRTHIDRQSDEYSLTGSDDVVAANENISYSRSSNPNDLDELRSKAERQNHWSNPLNASPANKEMSDTTAETLGHKRYHIQEEKGSYPNKTTKKGGAKPGGEKKAFAGSTTGGKRKGQVESSDSSIQKPGLR